MSYKAILNVNLLAARVGANELEFCFKKINSYKSFEQKSRFVENVAKAVEEIIIEEIKKFWPKEAPDINNVQKYVSKYKNEKIVIKNGGDLLIDRDGFENFILD